MSLLQFNLILKTMADDGEMGAPVGHSTRANASGCRPRAAFTTRHSLSFASWMKAQRDTRVQVAEIGSAADHVGTRSHRTDAARDGGNPRSSR